MSKQPYIPFYVGDYLKDTRILPLAVRGAWVDLILFMWDAPVRGELIGTLQEISRMIGCDSSEAKFALDLLNQKKTADIILLTTGEYKIVSRRMKKDAEISAIRSEVGKKGVLSKKERNFAEPKGQAKPKQNPEYDNDNDYDIELNIKGAFDEIYIEGQKMKWPHLDFLFEYRAFCEKVRGSPDHYKNHDTGGLRLAFQKQLRDSKNKVNGHSKDKREQHITSLAADFAAKYGSSNQGT